MSCKSNVRFLILWALLPPLFIFRIQSANFHQVVPEYSARMDLPNEMVFPVNAHHRNICRYPSNGNQTYVLVEAAIKEIVSEKSPSLKSGETYLQQRYVSNSSVLLNLRQLLSIQSTPLHSCPRFSIHRQYAHRFLVLTWAEVLHL